jgi:two-component system chemotaxis response regulator CheB
VTFGPRVVGLIMSGRLFDGAAGLDAIKRCGGITMVQEPSDALEAELPSSALSASLVDYCLPATQIGSKLLEVVHSFRGSPEEVPAELRVEADLALAAGKGAVALNVPGKSVPLTCPACDGPLHELNESGQARFRCEVGHAYGVDALLVDQSRSLERALWIALRTLQERAVLLGRMADEASSRGFPSSAVSYEQRRLEIEEHVTTIRRVIGMAAKDIAPPIAAGPVDD